jgi:hypothetical protein
LYFAAAHRTPIPEEKTSEIEIEALNIKRRSRRDETNLSLAPV